MRVRTVLVKLTDPADRERCRAEMMRMDGRIDGMVDMAVRVNEDDGGYAADVSLTTRWADEEAYRGYEEHPLHLEVRAAVLSMAADVTTFDYTAPDDGG